MAEALYRKYRPQIFEDVVGQEHIERTIKNAIEQDKVSHAYLFTGPRGTGKTTTARLLAKALLCDKGPTAEPDGTCDNCLEIANGTHPDVYELDAASRTGVENVREEIIGRVQFAPTRGRSKVYIIDEVHMLSTAAFNALLKTLEEPPSHVVFILCTTDPQKVPETIHSRCQRFDFRRISSEAIVSRLGAICVAEDVEFEGDALDLIAYRAEGGMRNALTSLEQVIAFGEGKVTLANAERLLGSLDTNDMAEIVRFIGSRDIASCFTWTSEYIETGADLAQFTRDLAEHIRNMYVLALAGTDTVLEVSEATRRELVSEMELFGPDRLARLLGVLGDLSAELRTSTNPRLSFEIALTRMVRPDSDLTLESLAERIEALESGYSAVSHVVAASPQAQPSATAAQQVAPAQQHTAPAAQPAASVQASGAGDAHSAAPAFDPAAEDSVPEPVIERQPSTSVPPSAQADVTAAQPAGAVGGFDNPAALQRIWQAALSSIKKAKAAYGVLFLNTKAIHDAERGGIVIEFPPENAFAFNAVQKPEVFEVVKASLSQAAGADIPFRYAQGGGAAVPSGTASPAQSAAQSVVAAPQAAAVQREASPAASQSVPTQAQPAQSVPSPSDADRSEPSAYAAPDDDRPPLDAYDSMYVPSEADDPYAPAPASSGMHSAASPVADSPVSQQADAPSSPAASSHTQPASADRSAPASQPSSVGEPVSAADASDIESILAAGFGDGITFEEVE
ncbi:DNA polymerase III subunit gamma/tau [Raoultibacter phocaeensis]|uniref:DNA polymerase III subunit gamma/tau n=1 Tax=Raoultibacter phocaeensis TaxID=2479841 RepID=UPI0011196EE6|nr:DNA polymerase III subunit gamma/tau [Raoultibacter phocaeensis]